MNNIFKPKLKYLGTFIGGTILALTVLITDNLPTPVFANTTQETIEQRITELRGSTENWIEINLATQRLIAWEGNKAVYAIIVSTGKKTTPTPPGIFSIYSKRRLDRMRGADYDVPDVPFAMYYQGGYAIHGAYWHNRFGTPVSHGCTNVAVDHAEWLFNWATVGTPVIVHNGIIDSDVEEVP